MAVQPGPRGMPTAAVSIPGSGRQGKRFDYLINQKCFLKKTIIILEKVW